jgi:phospholipid/cholesterol/gamma-HCH transport system permease protein
LTESSGGHHPHANRLPALTARFAEASKQKLHSVQEYFSLAGKALRFAFVRPFYAQDLVQQMDEIGVKSLGIVLLTGFFTGMVLALQSSVQMAQFGATMYIGRLVAGSMIRELGPVLAALIMMPVLTVINDVVGIIGGNLISTLMVGVPTGTYWRTVWEQIASGGFTLRFIPNDFLQGLAKPFVFGGIISITACYFGLNTTGGTEGVGQATTRTVVLSSILILVVDYFLTQILLSVLGA